MFKKENCGLKDEENLLEMYSEIDSVKEKYMFAEDPNGLTSYRDDTSINMIGE